MYIYDDYDHELVRARVERFRDQVQRRLSGALSEEEFKPLRLQNGLYLQLHAYMLRVAIPYGTLSSRQLHQLANISERFDKSYGHFTTRQNIQFNWVKLEDAPDILDALAEVEMHAIQTSGNCIRNVTADHFAGAAADELEDPRPTAELLRQWSTDHPEFAFLPRKFKIAVTGSPNDRAVTKAHDIGLRMVRNAANELGYEVVVGGGLGRTPIVGKVIRSFLPKDDLLPYIESIVRVYNLHGRRDNKYKARIKILVQEMGLDAFKDQVDAEFARQTTSDNPLFTRPTPEDIARIEAYFAGPVFEPVAVNDDRAAPADPLDDGFLAWKETNVFGHREAGYAIATISLKPIGGVPGDASADQMRAIAAIAQTYSHDELRISHEQNVVLPHVRQSDLPAVYKLLQQHDLHTANIGQITDIIACPGLDYCALATARSIPIAQDISQHFADPAYAKDIGELKIKISGCINACAHHHVGHIGILGLEKAGVENYQITFGGDHTETMAIGDRAGRGLDADQVVPALERVIEIYRKLRRSPEETFVMAYRRIGLAPFKAALYPELDKTHAA